VDLEASSSSVDEDSAQILDSHRTPLSRKGTKEKLR
jgi:hypothetical protein